MLARAFLLRAYHQDGAVSMTDDGVGDAAYKRTPYPTQAPAAGNDEFCSYLFAQNDDLLVRASHPEMGRASSWSSS
jgi:hypothetical protein